MEVYENKLKNATTHFIRILDTNSFLFSECDFLVGILDGVGDVKLANIFGWKETKRTDYEIHAWNFEDGYFLPRASLIGRSDVIAITTAENLTRRHSESFKDFLNNPPYLDKYGIGVERDFA